MTTPDPFVYWSHYKPPEPPSKGAYLVLFFFAALGTVLLAAELYVNGFQIWLPFFFCVVWFVLMRGIYRYEEWKRAQE